MIRLFALVTYRIYPTQMGGQKGVALFYEALQRHVTAFLALSKNNVVSNTENQKKILYTNRLLPLNIFCIGHLKKLTQQQGAQIFIAEHSYAGWIAWLLKKRTGLPFIIHSHNLEGQRFRHMHRWWWRLYERYEKRIHQKADFNFFISDVDKMYAIEHFQLHSKKCATITYGVQPFTAKTPEEKNSFLKSNNVSAERPILFFNGTLDYEPNIEAIYNLANELAPRLTKTGQLFQILISGNRISKKLKEFINEQPHFIYLDYVPDVNIVYQSVQLFLNPILNNTGVKTKVLEAIANQCTVVSTVSGATGIYTNVCGSKLMTVTDGDWDTFTNEIVQVLRETPTQTPARFFDVYLWSNIAQKAADEITAVVAKK